MRASHFIIKQTQLHNYFEQVEITVAMEEVILQLTQLTLQPTLRQRIVNAQWKNPYLVNKFPQAEAKQVDGFSISFENGLLYNR